MALRQELGRLLEQYQREETDAKEAMARAEHRLETIARQRPKVLALLEELSTDEELPRSDGGCEGIHANGDDPRPLRRQNPFGPSVCDYDCWEILAAAGQPMRVRDVALELSKRQRRNVRLSTVENVFYSRNPEVFERVAPGTFQLRRNGA